MSPMDVHGRRLEQIDALFDSLHYELRAQTRVLAIIVVTAMLGVAGLSFAAASLL